MEDSIIEALEYDGYTQTMYGDLILWKGDQVVKKIPLADVINDYLWHREHYGDFRRVEE